jgi:hypothetical protein
MPVGGSVTASVSSVSPWRGSSSVVAFVVAATFGAACFFMRRGEPAQDHYEEKSPR